MRTAERTGRSRLFPVGLLAVTVIGLLALAPRAPGAFQARGTIQENPALYTDSLRVDSLRARLSPDRLEALRREAAGNEDPRSWYDLGAALLLAGDWEGALEPLQRVVASARSGRAVEAAAYNLGVAQGVAGRPTGASGAEGASAEVRRAALLRARDAFRRVLRLDSAAEDARWNLEVVENWLTELGGEGGGGDGGQGGGQEGPSGQSRDMTPEEVQRLLEAAAAEERRVQQERFQDSRDRDPAAERNW